VLGQLLAMRATLDNLIGALEDAPAAKVICLHPEDQREYRGGMGNVTGFKCRRCDTEVESTQ
jgi:hypothetical protein